MTTTNWASVVRARATTHMHTHTQTLAISKSRSCHGLQLLGGNVSTALELDQYDAQLLNWTSCVMPPSCCWGTASEHPTKRETGPPDSKNLLLMKTISPHCTAMLCHAIRCHSSCAVPCCAMPCRAMPRAREREREREMERYREGQTK